MKLECRKIIFAHQLKAIFNILIIKNICQKIECSIIKLKKKIGTNYTHRYEYKK